MGSSSSRDEMIRLKIHAAYISPPACRRQYYSEVTRNSRQWENYIHFKLCVE